MFLSTPHKTFLLKKVLHTPHLTTNLVSISQFFQDNNTFIEFHPSYFLVKEKDTSRILLHGQLEKGSDKIPIAASSSLALVSSTTQSIQPSFCLPCGIYALVIQHMKFYKKFFSPINFPFLVIRTSFVLLVGLLRVINSRLHCLCLGLLPL